MAAWRIEQASGVGRSDLVILARVGSRCCAMLSGFPSALLFLRFLFSTDQEFLQTERAVHTALTLDLHDRDKDTCKP
jgi:hypothetical protein